jgi:hypothetical protein
MVDEVFDPLIKTGTHVYLMEFEPQFRGINYCCKETAYNLRLKLAFPWVYLGVGISHVGGSARMCVFFSREKIVDDKSKGFLLFSANLFSGPGVSRVCMGLDSPYSKDVIKAANDCANIFWNKPFNNHNDSRTSVMQNVSKVYKRFMTLPKQLESTEFDVETLRVINYTSISRYMYAWHETSKEVTAPLELYTDIITEFTYA